MRKLFVAAALGLGCSLSSIAAELQLLNVDPPGIGFNDPTPAVPVGGNTGTTVGAQRLIAYQRALELWGRTLRSRVPVVVQGSFARLTCTATGGTLAQAGTTFIFSDFPGAPLAGHWYHSALADAISGRDLVFDDTGETGVPDIVANFNGDVGNADCIAGPGWYYGLDNQAPAGQTDFLDTFMHEVSHGLGFSNFANEASGGTPAGAPDVYMANTMDLSSHRLWNTFTPAEIAASAINDGKVVWTGPNVTANSRVVLGPFEGVRVTGAINQEVAFGTASFGPLPDVNNFNGTVVLATDSVAAPGGGSVTDGCEPITAPVAGKVALVDRGLCGFAVKAKNAQNAGAVAVIVANTLGRGVQGMGGTDVTVTIPSILISNADGDAIKAALPTVNTAYFVDPTRRAGAAEGFVRLYAPTVVALGSSISHFDTAAVPNLLMEPFINPDLRSARNLDLTPALMKDIGWRLRSLRIGECNTGVESVLPTGQLLHVDVEVCAAGAKNKGQFVSCMAKVTDQARKDKLLSGSDRSDIMKCAAQGYDDIRRDEDDRDHRGHRRGHDRDDD